MPRIGSLTVYVRDAHGDLHAFLPGDEVPAWAAKLMGPHCFDDSAASVGNDAPRSRRAPAAHTEAPHRGDGPPPLAGAGAGRDEWAEYAQSHDITVGEDWKRGHIIAACRNAGVPVE